MRVLAVSSIAAAMPLLLWRLKQNNNTWFAALVIAALLILQFASVMSSLRDVQGFIARSPLQAVSIFAAFAIVAWLILSLLRNPVTAGHVQTVFAPVQHFLTVRLGLPERWVPEVLLLTATLFLVPALAFWTSANVDTEAAAASLERSIAHANIRSSSFSEAVLTKAMQEAAWPVVDPSPHVERAARAINERRQAAADLLGRMQAPSDRKTRAQAEIRQAAETAQAALQEELVRAAAQAAASYRSERAETLRRRIEAAGDAAGVRAKPGLVAAARARFEADTSMAPAERAREIAATMQQELDAAVRAAMEAEARQALRESATAAKERADRALAEAGTRSAAAAASIMNTVVARLNGTMEQERREQEKRDRDKEAADYVAREQNAAAAQRAPRFAPLRSQFRALGFEVCEDQGLNGQPLYLANSAITSEQQCAVMCKNHSACDGFQIRNSGGSLHCMILRNSSAQYQPGAISGRKGGC